MLEQKYLDEIRVREQSATPGPWSVAHNWPKHHSCWIEDAWEGDREAGANTEFMLCAREDIPALLAEIERLRTALQAAPCHCNDCEYGSADEDGIFCANRDSECFMDWRGSYDSCEHCSRKGE